MKDFIKGLVAIGALCAFYKGGYLVGCADTVHAINTMAPEEMSDIREKIQEVDETYEKLKDSIKL